MLALLPSPAKGKPGSPRWAPSEVKPATLRKQRQRDRKRLAKLVAAGLEPPRELLNIPYGKSGRPRLSDEEIMLEAHSEARRKRAQLASKVELLPPSEVEAVHALAHMPAHREAAFDCEEARAAAMAANAAERKAARWERECRLLQSRGNDGRSSLFSEVPHVPADDVPSRECDPVCRICYDDLQLPCPRDERTPGVWGYTVCCAAYCHVACAERWWRMQHDVNRP